MSPSKNPLPPDRLQDLIEGVRARKIRSIGRALSLVEGGPLNQAAALIRPLFPESRGTFVLGVTGSPGAGKSTLVNALAARLVERGEKVGILAVDPTSPFSGGAFLGDRIRMHRAAAHPDVFIRSLATRGKLGGLSAAAVDAQIILGAAGYKWVIVETVGVGQDEVEITRCADVTAVILVPGMGDGIQLVKAGMMEIADLFVVNKADLEGTDRLRRDLEEFLRQGDADRTVPLFSTVATTGEGMKELTEHLVERKESSVGEGSMVGGNREYWRDVLLERLGRLLLERVSEARLDELVDRICDYELDPYSAVNQLLESEFGSKSKGRGKRGTSQ